MRQGSQKRYAVLGGGVVGLCVARRLARLGSEVVLIEKRHLGSGASGAAAGILNPPIARRSPFQRALGSSFDGYPAFVEELVEESGLDIEFARPGILYVIGDPGEEKSRRKKHDRFVEQGLPSEWCSSDDLKNRLPCIPADMHAGQFLPQTAWVRPRDLLQALRLSAESAGATIREDLEEVSLERSGNQVVVSLRDREGSSDRLEGHRVVVCAGAWTPELLEPIGEEIEAAVVPIRGQMIELRCSFQLPCMLHVGETYIIPRPGATIWVGATVEEVGFDATVTEGGIELLLASARRVLPSLASEDIVRSWSGLRPKVMRRGGALFKEGDIAVVAGHYRSGILMGPRDADRMVAALLGVEVEQFSPFPPTE